MQKIRSLNLPDIACSATEYLLPNIGVTLLKLVPTDPEYREATFMASVLTPCQNSKGIPHIIEHSVLNGSESFRLKEPFQVLLQSSLNTYLNAGTFSEHTVFPCASKNETDFYNLVSVYLDAIFNPLLHQDDRIFAQEGHRLRVEDGKLTRHGIVLNEMRGSYSSALTVTDKTLKSMIFADGSMRHDSGGNPAEIPQLTIEEFRAYHRSHYTTDNVKLIFLSNFSIDKEVALVQKYAANRRGTPAKLVMQPSPRAEVKTIKFPTNDPNAHHIFGLGYLLHDLDSVDVRDYYLMNAIDQLIHDSPASPFKELVGGDFQSSLDNMHQQVHLKTFCTDSKLSFEEYQKVVAQVYQDLASTSNYVTKEGLVAALNQQEFRLLERRENNGVTVGYHCLQAWQYGAPFEKFLQIQQTFTALRQDPNLAQKAKQLIKQYFCGPCVALNVEPDTELPQKEAEAVEREMAELMKEMSPEQIEAVKRIDESILLRQQQPDDPAELQKMKGLTEADVSGIAEEISHLQGNTEIVENISFWKFEMQSSGIVYAQLLIDVTQDVDKAFLNYLALAVRLFTRIRTDRFRTIQELNQAIENVFGALKFKIALHDTENGPRVCVQAEFRFLKANTTTVYELLHDILTTTCHHIEPDDLKRIAIEYNATLKQMLTKNKSANLATSRAQSPFSAANSAKEYIEGLSMSRFLQDYAKICIADLVQLQQHFCYKYPLLCALGCEKDQIQNQQKQFCAVFKHFRETEVNREFHRIPLIHAGILPQRQKSVGFASAVNYVSVGFGHNTEVEAPVLLATTLLGKSFLWDKVRVAGGAYGCFVQTSYQMLQSITSYRDPKLEDTIKVFKEIPSWLRELALNEDELWKVKLGALGQRQKSDAPLDRFSDALQYFLGNINVMIYGNVVGKIAKVTLQELKATAEVFETLITKGAYVVVGNQAMVQQFAPDDWENME